MSDKSSKGSKPLRSTADKFRDVYNTYVRQDGRVMPIKEKEPEKENDKMKEIIEEKTSETEARLSKNDSAIPDIDDKISEAGLPSNEATNEAKADEISLLKANIKALEAERNELREKLLRTTAEMENFRRRTAKERQELIEYANQRLLYKMLELLDDIQNALEHSTSTSENNTIVEGISLIGQKAEKLFADAGVKKMDDPVGKPFDVHYHEALMHIPSEIPEGSVVQVIQNGYMYNERVLRHAKVVTSSGKPDNSTKSLSDS